MDATVVVVEDGARHSHVGQGEVARNSTSGVLAFFSRMLARIASYITRTRHFFVFTVFRGGNVEIKEDRRVVSKTEVKVKESVLVEASGAFEPELVEILVSQQEAVNHSLPGVDSKVVVLNPDDCGSESIEQTKEDEQLEISNAHLPILDAEGYVACTIEDMLATGQVTTDPLQQKLTAVPLDFGVVGLHLEDHGYKIANHMKVAKELETCGADELALSFDNHEEWDIEHKSASDQPTSDLRQHVLTSATCEPVIALPLDLDTVDHLEGDAQRTGLVQEQNAFQGESVQNVISEKCIIFQTPSPIADANDSTTDKLRDSAKDDAPESPKLSASLPKLNTSVSIDQLNATVGEQLVKHLRDLERVSVTGKPESHATWNSRTTHKRAIILATLVAVAVWARNAKQLHESMPRIRGSAINMHIRSRL